MKNATNRNIEIVNIQKVMAILTIASGFYVEGRVVFQKSPGRPKQVTGKINSSVRGDCATYSSKSLWRTNC